MFKQIVIASPPKFKQNSLIKNQTRVINEMIEDEAISLNLEQYENSLKLDEIASLF